MARTVLVATDLSEHSRQAITCAYTWAKSINAQLHVLYVRQDFKDILNTGLDVQLEDGLKLTSHKLDQFALEQVKNFIGKTTLEVSNITIRSGDAANEIIEFSNELKPALLVMGLVGHSLLRELFVGNVTKKVAIKCQCPLLAVASNTSLPTKVLIPYENENSAKMILESLNGLLGKNLHSIELLHIITPQEIFEKAHNMDDLGKIDQLKKKLEEEDKKTLELTANQFRSKGMNIHVNINFSNSMAIENLLSESIEKQGFDLVTLAPHNRHGVNKWLFGSVSDHLLHTPPSNILILK